MIPIITLEIHVQGKAPLDLGANPGSALRGALYSTLRLMYDTGQSVSSRKQKDENPVAWLLALEDRETSGGKDVPRPMAVRPPLSPPAEYLSFGLTFYGNGQEYIPMVLSAVHAMGLSGVGRGRQRFDILRVEQVIDLNGKTIPLLENNYVHLDRLCPPPMTEDYRQAATLLAGKPLIVDFLTPARIVCEGHLCRHPHFRPWFQRLLERARQIGELYTSSPPWIPFRDLLAAADEVRVADDRTRWIELRSGSRRQGKMLPASGFAGAVTYTNLAPALLPWVLLGQGLQVGKNTIKGNGWYRIQQHFAPSTGF